MSSTGLWGRLLYRQDLISLDKVSSEQESTASFCGPETPEHWDPDRRVDTQHVKLALSVDVAKRSLSGTCFLTFTVRDELVNDIALDSIALAVSSMKLVGDGPQQVSSFGYSDDKLVARFSMPLEKASTHTIEIIYTVRHPAAGLYFWGPDKQDEARMPQVWSQNQDEDARYWFPCFDHPGHKFSSEMVITTDEAYTVLSNGRRLSCDKEKNGLCTTHWLHDKPHPAYLITLVIGTFVHETIPEAPHVDWYVDPKRAEDGRRAFGRTHEMMTFFSEKLGIQYPWGSYSQIAVQDFIFGGMENTGATTQTDRILLDERAARDMVPDALISHELAHQWFGNLVTCKSWSHAWLNEGFASYCEALWWSHDKGQDEFDFYVHRMAQGYFQEDREDYRRPIVTRRYNEPIDLFDAHLYEKGGCVLHSLRSEIGETAFWAGIKKYLETYRFASAETIDFVRVMENVSGRSLGAFFDQWIFKSGYPEIEVSYSWDAVKCVCEVSLKQTQKPTAEVPLFSATVPLFVHSANKKSVHKLKFNPSGHALLRLNMAEEPDFIEVDPHFSFLRTLKLKLSATLLEKIVTKGEGVVGRIEALDALLHETEASGHELTRILSSAWAKEAFWGVRSAMARTLAKQRGSAARAFLIQSLKTETHHKVRRALIDSLGNFLHDEEILAELLPIAGEDLSYFVEAEAARSIGRLRCKDSLPTLVSLLQNKNRTWNETVEQGIVDGFRALGSVQARLTLDHLLPLVREGAAPTSVQAKALLAIGSIGEDHEDAYDALIRALSRPHFLIQMAAIRALGILGESKALAHLEHFTHYVGDGRIRGQASTAISQIHGKKKQHARLASRIDEMDQSNRKLKDRLERLEKHLKDNTVTLA